MTVKVADVGVLFVVVWSDLSSRRLVVTHFGRERKVSGLGRWLLGVVKVLGLEIIPGGVVRGRLQSGAGYGLMVNIC